jgi:hypothetical protein
MASEKGGGAANLIGESRKKLKLRSSAITPWAPANFAEALNRSRLWYETGGKQY